jgi:hypothetical protein
MVLPFLFTPRAASRKPLRPKNNHWKIFHAHLC